MSDRDHPRAIEDAILAMAAILRKLAVQLGPVLTAAYQRELQDLEAAVARLRKGAS